MAGVFVTTSSLTRVYKSVSMGCANGSSLVTVDSILPKSSEACFGSVGERRRLVSQFELASTRSASSKSVRASMSKPLDPSLAEQYLAAIVQNADDAIVSKDLNSIVTSWNPAAARIFGFTADEMIGQSIMGIIPPELAGEENEIVMDCCPGNAAASSMTTVSAVNKWLVQ